MNTEFSCWQCGKTLSAIMPLSRRETCEACNADQHVCKLCKHYDPKVSDQCREDRAETVTDKERANFCDYFNLYQMAYKGASNDKQRAAKAQLDALFGDSISDSPEPETPQDKNEAARKALEDLFSTPDPKK